MELHVLRVFVDDNDANGDELGIFLDGGSVPKEARQRVATELGFPETVFVDDAASGTMQLNTPVTELVFAGHPTVGTAWLIAQQFPKLDALHPPAGKVHTTVEGDTAFVSAKPEWCPPFEFIQLDTPAEVGALDGPPEGMDLVSMWAWEDEPAGKIFARVFIGRLGIPEDQATGSAAIPLSAQLGRNIEIRQGLGSVLLARPARDGFVDLGGRVVFEGVRDFDL